MSIRDSEGKKTLIDWVVGDLAELKSRLNELELVAPICPVCGGVMVDFSDADIPAGLRFTPPRFVCKNADCRKKLLHRGGGTSGYIHDEYEDSDFRTGFWQVRDLKNPDEYGAAESDGKIRRIADKWQNRDKFR